MELLDSVFTDEDSRQKIKACRDAIDEGVPFPEAVERWASSTRCTDG